MSNPLWSYFQSNSERNAIHKWHHHFNIFHKYLEPYLTKKNIVILEIGVGDGGSLEMWRHYFGPNAEIYGIDSNEAVITREANNKNSNNGIFIGDQADKQFLNYVIRRIAKPIDIIIDDGGHTWIQQITSLETLFDSMSPKGVYICESTSTSYMPNSVYSNSNKEETFMSFIQNNFINAMHFGTIEKTNEQNKIQKTTHSVHIYPNIVVIERAPYSDTMMTHSIIGIKK